MTRVPKFTALLRQLIATPSVSSVEREFDQGNRAVIDLLADWLDAVGFSVEVMPIPGYTDKANLIARLGSGDKGLVLAGHTDTVPYDSGRWNRDPFRLHERDGRFYGLGTADMKAFFALAIDAVRQLRATDLTQALTILATADEESSMCGAQALVEAGRPRARYAVIGEPTGLRPVRMHKGIMMEGIRLRGQSGHSSDPALGNSAIEGMHEVIKELLAWRGQLQQRLSNAQFSVPVATLNLGRICGGDNPNRICGACELDIDLRPLPGMAIAELREELIQHLRPVAEARGLEFDMRSLFRGVDAFATAASSSVVKSAEEFTGAVAGAVGFATEGPFLAQLGIETIILGPGDIAQAHQPDEYLSADRITPTVTLLRRLVNRFCRAPGGGI